MDNANVKLAGLTARLKEEFLRDKRKTAVLVVVALVMLVVLAVRTLHGSAPAKAVGAQPAGVTAPTADRSRLSAWTDSIAGEQIAHAAAVAPRDASHSAITRDLFALNEDLFPPRQQAVPVAVLSNTKGDADKAEESIEHVVQAQARALILQSTIVSEDPIAIINGTVLRVGDSINGFRVVSISPRGCTMKKRGVTVFLEMN